MHYLYSITNQINGKIYIGQSLEPGKRWSKHKSDTKNKPTQYIHRAMVKYGIENFTFDLIATCKNQDDADITEEQLIAQYDSRNSEKGYNIKPGGNSSSPSSETIQKIKQWWKDHPNQNDWLKGENNPFYGKQHSEEAIQKNIEAHKGKTHTEEWKQNHSEFMKELIKNNPNMGFTSERMKGNQINKGRKHSDEVNKSKGRVGGNSGSFKRGQPPIYTNKGKKWKLVNGKREYYQE